MAKDCRSGRNNRPNNSNNNLNNVQCFRCDNFGHMARNCRSRSNNQNNNQNNNSNRNNNPNRNNNSNQNNNFNNNRNNGQNNKNNRQNSPNRRNVNNIEVPEVQALSSPPIRNYDIVPDVWNQHAHVTVRELLANGEYRKDLMTALNTMDNRSVNQVERATTTALTMNVRIGEEVQTVIPDSGAAVSVISQKLAVKHEFVIKKLEEKELRAIGHEIRIIGIVEKVPLTIGTAKIPIDLRVINEEDDTFLLGMDWFNQYGVILNTKKKELIFTSESQDFRTYVKSEKVKKTTIFYVTVVKESEDELEVDIPIIEEERWMEGFPEAD